MIGSCNHDEIKRDTNQDKHYDNGNRQENKGHIESVCLHMKFNVMIACKYQR